MVSSMMGGKLLLGVVCVGLMAFAVVADGAPGEPATSVVVGMAQCTSCSRKNLDAEAAFKGLQVAIKCKNSSFGGGEYESKAVGELDGSGAFAVPLPASVDLRGGADCVAQLHSAAASASPCPGQEPSRIVPLSSSEGTFVAVASKTRRYPPSSSPDECASANICFPCHRKHLLFGRKHFFMHPRMKPWPEYDPPTPEYGTPPAPECPPPAPVYGTPVPQYPPPTVPVYGTPAPRCLCNPGAPTPGCQCPPPAPVYGTPMPEYPPPPTPVYGRCECSPPTPGCQCPPPAPVYGTPVPEYPPPTPVYGTPTPGCEQCPPPTPEYGTPPTPECPPITPAYGTSPLIYTPPAHY